MTFTCVIRERINPHLSDLISYLIFSPYNQTNPLNREHAPWPFDLHVS